MVRIKQIDAFTRKPFTGNPAAVVLDADKLNRDDMQKIANEMNLSETAFVMKPENEQDDLRIRWFTPTQEVELCGHATIAVFHAMAEEGRCGLEVGESQSFRVDTKVGTLTVDVEWKDLNPYIKFALPIPTFYPYPDDLSILCGALGLSKIELSQKVAPQVMDNGYCYVPLSHYDSLKTLEPNQHLLKKLNEKHNLTGFAVVTTDTGDKDTDWHMRFFAPSLGVFEDPVTGSANGPMAAFLWNNGFLDKNKPFHSFKATQGRFVNRTGYVTVNLSTDGEKVGFLQIAGDAVTVMEGSIRLYSTVSEPL